MLRLILPRAQICSRAVRPARYPLTVRAPRALAGLQFSRYNSSQPEPPADKEEAKKRQEKLQADWDAPKLTYEQVKPRTEQPSPDAYLIDVREPDEVIQGSIPSSVNLPLSVIASSFHLNPVSFKEKHGFQKPKRDQEMVFYCRSGKRSATACDVAKRNGYTNIFNYEGSWLDWTAREQNRK